MKTALNVVLKAGGGFIRRPGSDELAQIATDGVRFRYRGRGLNEELVFYNTGVKIYAADGTLNQTITSCPWVTADLEDLHFTGDANSVFVFSTAFLPRELKRASNGTWALSAFAFAPTVNGKTSQPFYDKFNPIDVSITIAGYTGSGVAITFSDDVLEAGHVGLKFRYLTACEVEIATVTNATTGTVNIIDALYPTLVVTVADSSIYKVGHVVQGTVSNVTGLVTALPSGTTLRVVLLEGYENFVYSATAADCDTLVGPEGGQKLTAACTTYGTPATTTIWDEQLLSGVRGYPGTGVIHKNRLIMGAFPEATDVVCGSALGNFYNFEVGAEDEDGFNEELGADPNSQIRHFVSSEQLLVFTDRGVYYVPESPEAPLTPTSIQFAVIGPDGASAVRPVLASEGVMFIDADAGRLMVIAQTGNVRRSWQVAELSEAAYHLLTGPKKIVVANGLDGRTERYAMVLNDDGTIACMMYRRGSEVIGFSKWTHGSGTFHDITGSEDDVILTSKVGAIYTMSQMSFSATVDDEQDYSSSLTGRNGQTCHVVQDRAVIGGGLVASGDVPDIAPAAGLTAGWDFEVDATPAPQIDTERGWARQRVVIVWVDVIDTGSFRVGETEYIPFTGTDALDDPGKVRSGVIRAHQLGWSEEATKSINQQIGSGCRLDVRSITMEVAQ